MLNKINGALLVVLTMGSMCHAQAAEYFELPATFQADAILTITSLVTILLAVRALPVAWKYVVQFFGKKNA